jgi:hypothetical protein
MVKKFVGPLMIINGVYTMVYIYHLWGILMGYINGVTKNCYEELNSILEIIYSLTYALLLAAMPAPRVTMYLLL